MKVDLREKVERLALERLECDVGIGVRRFPSGLEEVI